MKGSQEQGRNSVSILCKGIVKLFYGFLSCLAVLSHGLAKIQHLQDSLKQPFVLLNNFASSSASLLKSFGSIFQRITLPFVTAMEHLINVGGHVFFNLSKNVMFVVEKVINVLCCGGSYILGLVVQTDKAVKDVKRKTLPVSDMSASSKEQ